jgi:3-oxoacyl-[acyl-carrier protein] reductase
METGLRGRVAIVAASSQGIGRETAAAFAAEGCRVAMCARTREKLEAAAQEIRKQSGAEVLTQAFDVTDAAAVHNFVEAMGSISVWPTPAGHRPRGFWRPALKNGARQLTQTS